MYYTIQFVLPYDEEGWWLYNKRQDEAYCELKVEEVAEAFSEDDIYDYYCEQCDWTMDGLQMKIGIVTTPEHIRDAMKELGLGEHEYMYSSLEND